MAVTKVILGEAPPELPPMVAGDTATETVWQVAMEQSKYWKNIDPKACEPREGKGGRSTSVYMTDESRRGGRDDVLYTWFAIFAMFGSSLWITMFCRDTQGASTTLSTHPASDASSTTYD